MSNQQFNKDSPSPGMRQDVDTVLTFSFLATKMKSHLQAVIKQNKKLNTDQEKVWKTVHDAVQGTSPNTIFVTGDSGTRKTYLNTIISRIIEMRIRVIASAFIGCTGTLLFGGATVHSVFRFGINLDQDYTPSVSKQGFHGKRISESQVIIIDEGARKKAQWKKGQWKKAQ
jgi:hypothetical protein